MFYSLSLMFFKEWECLASSFNVQCLFYPVFLLLVSSWTCEKLCFCFEMKILNFKCILSEVPSTVEETKYVQPKIEALTSLSARTSWYTIPSFTQCLPLVCIFSFFCLFIQIFIDFYPLSGEEFNKYSSSSHSKYPLMECTHVLSPMMPGKCGIDEDLYKQLFAFQ